jgi:transposase
MKNLIHISVKETMEELKTFHDKCLPSIKPRIRMLMSLKSSQPISISDLSRKAVIAYNSAVKWHNLYKQGGFNKLVEIKKGSYHMNTLPQEVFKAIEEQHKQKPFKNYTALYRWATENHSPNISYPQFRKSVKSHFNGDLVINKFLTANITESAEELEAIYDQCSAKIKARIKMLIVLKKEQKITHSVLAQKVGVAKSSTFKWYNEYQQRGITKLLEQKGEDPVISVEMHKAMSAKFKANAFKNFEGILQWIKSNYLPEIKYSTLHRYICNNFYNEFRLMRSVLRVPVKESEEKLETLICKKIPLIQSRVAMLIALKNNPLITRVELSRLLCVSPLSIDKWCLQYEEGGLERLTETKKRGRKKSIMPPEVDRVIQKQLDKWPAISVSDIYNSLSPEYSTRISYNRLYRYIHAHF